MSFTTKFGGRVGDVGVVPQLIYHLIVLEVDQSSHLEKEVMLEEMIP